MMNEPARSKPPATSPIPISQAPSPTALAHPPVAFFQPIARKPSKTTEKCVQFSDMCRVILIPKRQEYAAAGIHLWWTKTDFVLFKKDYQSKQELAQIQESNATIPSNSVTQEQTQEGSLEESYMSMSK